MNFNFLPPIVIDCASIDRLFIHRAWELRHMDLSWDFRKDLGAKVRGLLTILEHPINMAHLSKLFTAQLIISCNFDVNCQFFFRIFFSRSRSCLCKLTFDNIMCTLNCWSSVDEFTQNLSAKCIKNSYDDVLIFCIFIYFFPSSLPHTIHKKNKKYTE